jgi:hypothetical protein
VRVALAGVAALAAAGLACGSSNPVDGGAAGGGGSVTAGSGGVPGAAGSGGAPDTAGSGGAPDMAGAGGASGAAGDGGPGGAPGAGGAGVCTAQVAHPAEEGMRLHVPCTPVPVYGTNPPSSGNHYAIWADYKTYDTPVPWGHLMHSMEHGAVIIVYNCPGGCADEVAQAQNMIDALPVDPLCTAPTKRRVILAPDPKLTVRWAASAWTWTLRSTCFDATAFSAFVSAHYGMGGEDLCGELHEPFCDVPGG